MRGLWRNDAGSVALSGGAVILTAIAIGALAVDGGNLYLNQVRLQVAADAAALAAAHAVGDEAAAAAAATEVARRNLDPARFGEVLSSDEVAVGEWDAAARTFTPAAGASANAVRVVTRRSAARGNPVETFLALAIDNVDLSASAIARAGGSGPCVLALEPNSTNSIALDSNARIEAPDCDVHSNSSNPNAIRALSNTLLRSRSARAVGGYQGAAARFSPLPVTGPVIPDPLAHRPAPSVGGCGHTNRTIDSQTITLLPGVYCGGIRILNNAVVTFQPGVYVIKDGDFFVDSNSRVSGSGVGFYLTGNTSMLHFTSNTHIDFKAPTTGPLAGLLFFEDRSVPPMRHHRLDSNNVSRLEGTIYLSRGRLSLDSNSTIASSSAFTNVVVRRLSLDSNARLQLNASYDATDVPNALRSPPVLVD